jgi:hypothetical protein
LCTLSLEKMREAGTRAFHILSKQARSWKGWGFLSAIFLMQIFSHCLCCWDTPVGKSFP